MGTKATAAHVCLPQGRAVIYYNDAVYILTPEDGLQREEGEVDQSEFEYEFFKEARDAGLPVETRRLDEPFPFREFCEMVENEVDAADALRFLLVSVEKERSPGFQDSALKLANERLAKPKVYDLVKKRLRAYRSNPNFNWHKDREGKVGELLDLVRGV